MKISKYNDILENITSNIEEEVFNPHERVVIIDGLNLFFRNFAVMNTINTNGSHIGGMGGFIRSLIFLINKINPTSVYMTFDGEGSTTNRKNLNADYKAGRHLNRITNWDIFENVEEENDSKIDQITRLIQYLKCLPIKIISMDKMEADDVIAYSGDILSNEHNSQVFIVSNDKDFLQLINDKITVFRPTEKIFYDRKMVMEKFGMLAENFIHYKILLGDQSDNIEGIRGLGHKGILKRFPELKERPVSFDELIEISTSKYKEHTIYNKIALEETKLKNNFTIMNLAKPLIDDIDKKFIRKYITSPTPKLDIDRFMLYYKEDGLKNIIKNPEYTINTTFKHLK